MKILRGGGAPKYFLALKRGSESSRYTEGGGSKLFKVLVQQGPGVFTPTIVDQAEKGGIVPRRGNL
jgi:hypothetical protein